MTGLAMGSFDRAISYCLNDRKQFGKAIGEFQGMQFQFAQEAMEIEAARLLVYNAARLKEAGMPFVKEAAFAKLYGMNSSSENAFFGYTYFLVWWTGLIVASQVAQRVSGASIEQMGGVGFTRELGVEKYWRFVLNDACTNCQ
jgi:short-chain 2-methylacyl-CoA dehydrogenase